MKIVETKPRKAKFGFRYNYSFRGNLLVMAEQAREFARVCDLIHEVLGNPDQVTWWHTMPNNMGISEELLIYINDETLYEKFKDAVERVKV